MKYLKVIAFLMVFALLSGCGTQQEQSQDQPQSKPQGQVSYPVPEDAVNIVLSDESITVDGKTAPTDPTDAVYVANDIIYYESGKDFTYGEGDFTDAHSPEEAAAHTVVHIAKPGTYALSGKLSKGQIAVDLGSDAKKDPEAVVTLVLGGVDITCDVAPGVIFYNVYECGDDENPTKDVDTSKAGANVIIADGTENTVNGAYVAKIYKPDTVELNEAGTKVEDAKKLHKYDGAFYSKRSMNITGNTGTLNIYAANEGLDSEMHLTLNGGNVNIFSGNDGINTNEDGVSVTTINGGNLKILVTGETGEGDGIDSNGWLVINGGTVISSACARSADGGIDSDMGIHINGGTVIAGGSMLDRIEEGGQNFVVFSFMGRQAGNLPLELKNAQGNVVAQLAPGNDYSTLIYSSPDLKEGEYTLWNGQQQLSVRSGGAGGWGGMGGMGGFTGGMGRPAGTEGTNRPDREGKPGDQPSETGTPPEGQFGTGATPEGMQRPEGMDGQQPQQPPQGGQGGWPSGGFRPGGNNAATGEATTEFSIVTGGNYFTVVTQ